MDDRRASCLRSCVRAVAAWLSCPLRGARLLLVCYVGRLVPLSRRAARTPQSRPGAKGISPPTCARHDEAPPRAGVTLWSVPSELERACRGPRLTQGQKAAHRAELNSQLGPPRTGASARPPPLCRLVGRHASATLTNASLATVLALTSVASPRPASRLVRSHLVQLCSPRELPQTTSRAGLRVPVPTRQARSLPRVSR
jgi:hypothetical protein